MCRLTALAHDAVVVARVDDFLIKHVVLHRRMEQDEKSVLCFWVEIYLFLLLCDVFGTSTI